MTSSPKFTITLNYSHNFMFSNGSSVKFMLDTRYKTSYRLSWKKDDYVYNYQEPCHITGLSSIYSNSDGKWTFTGYVKNLENYAEKRGYMGDPINEMMVGNPRTYGAVLSVNF
jgi:hypothetical protein